MSTRPQREAGINLAPAQKASRDKIDAISPVAINIKLKDSKNGQEAAQYPLPFAGV
nr:hypothetical protein [Sphingomonas sp. CDS-1]